MPDFRSHAPAFDESVGADLLVVPVSDPPVDVARRLERLEDGVAASATKAIDLDDFRPVAGATHLVEASVGGRYPRVLLLGTGPVAERTSPVIRRAFATAAKNEVLRRMDRVAVYCGAALGTGADLAASVAAAADGLLDGGYSWTAATAESPDAPGSFLFLAEDARARNRVDDGLDRGRILGDAVSTAKDLANAPANHLSPADLAARARALAKRTGLTCRVLEEAGLRRERCHALLAVGGGSSRPPRLIVLEHAGRGKAAPVALVGKGLVFDTGGLNLKPGSSIVKMKFDKCGAAAVLGAMEAIARLELPVPVVAVVPAAENSVSGDAYRPGDVIDSRSGRTIEVLNTDAEGRLVLADALDYVIGKHAPQAVLDVATLTGAALHALGDRACAVLGTDDRLVRRVLEAGERTGERAWELPLWEEHLEDVQTPNAHVKNTGTQGAGTIAGAAFLRAFVGDARWAHLDIASVSRDRRNPRNGATGFGVRLLVDLLSRWPTPRVRRRVRGTATRRTRRRRGS